MTALELLGGRRDLDISPFVSAWDPLVERHDLATLDSRSVARAVKNTLADPMFIRGVGGGGELAHAIRAIAQATGDGQRFRRGLRDTTRELVEILATHGDTDYLAPIFEIAQRQHGCCVATLNYDLTIEAHGTASGVPVDTGIEGWSETGTWTAMSSTPATAAGWRRAACAARAPRLTTASSSSWSSPRLSTRSSSPHRPTRSSRAGPTGPTHCSGN